MRHNFFLFDEMRCFPEESVNLNLEKRLDILAEKRFVINLVLRDDVWNPQSIGPTVHSLTLCLQQKTRVLNPVSSYASLGMCRIAVRSEFGFALWNVMNLG